MLHISPRQHRPISLRCADIGAETVGTEMAGRAGPSLAALSGGGPFRAGRKDPFARFLQGSWDWRALRSWLAHREFELILSGAIYKLYKKLTTGGLGECGFGLTRRCYPHPLAFSPFFGKPDEDRIARTLSQLGQSCCVIASLSVRALRFIYCFGVLFRDVTKLRSFFFQGRRSRRRGVGTCRVPHLPEGWYRPCRARDEIDGRAQSWREHRHVPERFADPPPGRRPGGGKEPHRPHGPLAHPPTEREGSYQQRLIPPPRREVSFIVIILCEKKRIAYLYSIHPSIHSSGTQY